MMRKLTEIEKWAANELMAAGAAGIVEVHATEVTGPSDSDKIEQIREIFRNFDSGSDDLQYTLEKIQQIVED